MYHGLRRGETLSWARRFGWANPSPTEFANQLEYLSRRYVPVSLDDVLAWFETGAALPARAMLLTFDDGFQSVLTHAAPVLRRYRVPAVLFVIAGTLEQSYMPWFVPFNRMVERAAPNSVTCGAGRPGSRHTGPACAIFASVLRMNCTAVRRPGIMPCC
jgi:hypothetical protein